MGDEVNIQIEGVWGEIEMLQEIVGKNFDEISDNDAKLIMLWMISFMGSRGKDIKWIKSFVYSKQEEVNISF